MGDEEGIQEASEPMSGLCTPSSIAQEEKHYVSPSSAGVIPHMDARTRALSVKAELEELRQKRLAKIIYQDFADNGGSMPLTSSELTDFFLRQREMDKAWRQKHNESIDALHKYKHVMAESSNVDSPSSSKVEIESVGMSEVHPFFQQQRALDLEWRKQQKDSIAYLHNYRDTGLGLNDEKSEENVDTVLVTPTSVVADAPVAMADVHVADAFYDIQKALEERLSLATKCPLLDSPTSSPCERKVMAADPCTASTEMIQASNERLPLAGEDDLNPPFVDRILGGAVNSVEEYDLEEKATVACSKHLVASGGEAVKHLVPVVDGITEIAVTASDESTDAFESKSRDTIASTCTSDESAGMSDSSALDLSVSKRFGAKVKLANAAIALDRSLPDDKNIAYKSSIHLAHTMDGSTDTNRRCTVEVGRAETTFDSSEQREEATSIAPTGEVRNASDAQRNPIAKRHKSGIVPAPRRGAKDNRQNGIAVKYESRTIMASTGDLGLPRYMQPTRSTPERKCESASRATRPSPTSRSHPLLYSDIETAESFKIKSGGRNMKWTPELHSSKGACERCFHFASSIERRKFERDGHHYRISSVRSGCSRSGARLCRKCFYDTYKLAGNM